VQEFFTKQRQEKIQQQLELVKLLEQGQAQRQNSVKHRGKSQPKKQQGISVTNLNEPSFAEEPEIEVESQSILTAGGKSKSYYNSTIMSNYQ
jgi:hypothetical protein